MAIEITDLLTCFVCCLMNPGLADEAEEKEKRMNRGGMKSAIEGSERGRKYQGPCSLAVVCFVCDTEGKARSGATKEIANQALALLRLH